MGHFVSRVKAPEPVPLEQLYAGLEKPRPPAPRFSCSVCLRPIDEHDAPFCEAHRPVDPKVLERRVVALEAEVARLRQIIEEGQR